MHNTTEPPQPAEDIVEGWKQSRLSQVSFCKQEGISYYKFQYLCRKLRRQENKQYQSGGHFVKLRIKEPVQAAVAMEIHFPGGQRLIFHQPVEADYIKKLLS